MSPYQSIEQSLRRRDRGSDVLTMPLALQVPAFRKNDSSFAIVFAQILHEVHINPDL